MKEIIIIAIVSTLFVILLCKAANWYFCRWYEIIDLYFERIHKVPPENVKYWCDQYKR